MTTMNISLPEQMKDWVEARIDAGEYHNASEYMRDLIRRDQAEAEKLKTFREAIALGRESGAGSRSFEQIVADTKRKKP